MFEAFRAARRDQKVRLPGAQGESPETSTPEPEPEKRVEPPKVPVQEPASPRREPAPSWHQGVVEGDDVHVFPLGVRANVVFALSYNALIFVVVVLALVVFLTGFLGYSLGTRSSARTVETSGEEEITSDIEAVSPKDHETTKKDNGGVVPPTRRVAYRIRVLTVPNTAERKAAVEEDKRILEQQHGVTDVIINKSRQGSHLLLYAGAFTTDERDKAEAVVQQIKRIRVSGRDEFRDARVVPVQN